MSLTHYLKSIGGGTPLVTVLGIAYGPLSKCAEMSRRVYTDEKILDVYLKEGRTHAVIPRSFV